MIDWIIHPAVRLVVNKLRSSAWHELNKNDEFYEKYLDLFHVSNTLERLLLSAAQTKARNNSRKIYKIKRRDEARARIVKAAVNDTWDTPEDINNKKLMAKHLQVQLLSNPHHTQQTIEALMNAYNKSQHKDTSGTV